MNKKINIIGAGLAGCEAAWQIAQREINVKLFDMKPKKFSPAHKNPNLCELVCSNSFRSSDFEHNAVGLLQQEMRSCNSLILEIADITKVPAGGALAVDRVEFAKLVTEKIAKHPLIEIVEEEILELPDESFGRTIIATGPLTSETLAKSILDKIDNQALSFYDAIAPVIYTESIDFSKAWHQSRYDKGDAKDYINCPMSQEQYYKFIDELLNGQKVEFKDFEKPNYFDGCLPIEVMAERGVETLAFGPMKPVGLTNPHAPERPYAVIQLRQDNKQDTLRNIVGFQTKLKHNEQQRIFRTIPGLEKAEFAKLGGIHKNTFIKSPELLDETLRLKKMPHISFAGQITGCEGYIESAAIGLLAGFFATNEILQHNTIIPPNTTAIGAMLEHVTKAQVDTFQPMNINFGIFPTIQGQITANGKFQKIKGIDRKKAYSLRALNDIENWKKLSNF